MSVGGTGVFVGVGEGAGVGIGVALGTGVGVGIGVALGTGVYVESGSGVGAGSSPHATAASVAPLISTARVTIRKAVTSILYLVSLRCGKSRRATESTLASNASTSHPMVLQFQVSCTPPGGCFGSIHPVVSRPHPRHSHPMPSYPAPIPPFPHPLPSFPRRRESPVMRTCENPPLTTPNTPRIIVRP